MRGKGRESGKQRERETKEGEKRKKCFENLSKMK